jgi:hypothetical protein
MVLSLDTRGSRHTQRERSTVAVGRRRLAGVDPAVIDGWLTPPIPPGRGTEARRVSNSFWGPGVAVRQCRCSVGYPPLSREHTGANYYARRATRSPSPGCASAPSGDVIAPPTFNGLFVNVDAVSCCLMIPSAPWCARPRRRARRGFGSGIRASTGIWSSSWVGGVVVARFAFVAYQDGTVVGRSVAGSGTDGVRQQPISWRSRVAPRGRTARRRTEFPRHWG